MKPEELLQHFEQVKQYNGYWWGCCPVHGDSNPSMKIRIDKSGIWRFDCQRGCHRKDIIEAAGLTEADCGKLSVVKNNTDFEYVDEHIYITADRKPYLKVERYRDSKTGRKDFKQYHWNTGWELGAPKDQIPYRLPEVVQAISLGLPVIIVEGESCVDALVEAGFVATCNSCGSGKWTDTHTSFLKGVSRVYILPDNDPAGYEHLNKTAKSLQTAGIPVYWLQLPVGLKGDIVDWFKAGGTPETLKELIDNASIWSKAVPFKEYKPLPKTINAIDLMKKVFPDQVWIVPGLFPSGLTILGGKPKHGKSWLALGLCVSLAYGTKALGYKEVKQAGVLYLALEDTERRLQDRLGKLLKADPLSLKPPAALEFQTSWPRLNEGGAELLDEWLQAHPDVKFVVVDTLKRFRPPQRSRDSYYDQDYDAVNSLKQIADKHDISILVVHHLRKAASEDDPFDELSGSTGLSGAADTIAILKKAKGADGGATLYIRGRDIDEQELSISFDTRTYGWNILGPVEENPQGKTDQQSQILMALKAAGRPLLPKDIEEITGLKNDYIKLTLNRLHRQGKIHSMGIGKGWIIKHSSLLTTDNYDNGDNDDNYDNGDNSLRDRGLSIMGKELSLLSDDNPIDNPNKPSNYGGLGDTVIRVIKVISNDKDTSMNETKQGKQQAAASAEEEVWR